MSELYYDEIQFVWDLSHIVRSKLLGDNDVISPRAGTTSTSTVRSVVWRWCRGSSVRSSSTRHVQLPRPRRRSRLTNWSSTVNDWMWSGASHKVYRRSLSTTRTTWMDDPLNLFQDFPEVCVSDKLELCFGCNERIGETIYVTLFNYLCLTVFAFCLLAHIYQWHAIIVYPVY